MKGLSWADYWMERGRLDLAHDFEAFAAADAWASQRALAPPEGYVLVPVAPSVAMLSAGKNVNQDCEEDDPSWGVADVWGAMLAARPEAP